MSKFDFNFSEMVNDKIRRWGPIFGYYSSYKDWIATDFIYHPRSIDAYFNMTYSPRIHFNVMVFSRPVYYLYTCCN